MHGAPVLTPAEMQRIERLAFADGESEVAYMEAAGAGIARFIEEHYPKQPVTLLIGKGNNGGDAFVAGHLLKTKGYVVDAYALCPLKECSPLSQKMGKRFGQHIHIVGAPPPCKEGIILDGLCGTGFRGRAEGSLAELIDEANKSQLPIIAIDIPSGLNGATGEVESVAIKATHTLYLGLPKIGFYQKEGWNHVGMLHHIDFGLPEKYIEKAHPEAYLISQKRIKEVLPPMKRTRHKYETGYLLAIAGSKAMSGASFLACLAALKSGVGIVRLFHPEEMFLELSAAPYELIKESWDLKNSTRIEEEAARAKALLIGPGMGRSAETGAAIDHLLKTLSLPTIIDGDGLFFLTEGNIPEEAILTPHHGELKRLFQLEPTPERCQEFVERTKTVLVQKGAPTAIYYRNTQPLIVPYGDPGMASAGTGDVLTGIIGAFLAQGVLPQHAAAIGVLIHALSGEYAAREETSYGVTASSLIDQLPDVFTDLLRNGNAVEEHE